MLLGIFALISAAVAVFVCHCSGAFAEFCGLFFGAGGFDVRVFADPLQPGGSGERAGKGRSPLPHRG